MIDDVRCASPADMKSDRGRVGMGLGKGLGVLLLGVTVSFLSKDAFGHNDRNCAVVEGYFGLLWRINHPGERDTCDSGFTVAHASVSPVQL